MGDGEKVLQVDLHLAGVGPGVGRGDVPHHESLLSPCDAGILSDLKGEIIFEMKTTDPVSRTGPVRD